MPADATRRVSENIITEEAELPSRIVPNLHTLIMIFEKLDPTFLSHAASILAETNSGLSAKHIFKAMTAYSLKYDVQIPYAEMPDDPLTKRMLLLENLKPFDGFQQYKIIRELCDHSSFPVGKRSEERESLKVMLATRCADFAPKDEPEEINATLIEEVKHWLEDYPETLKLYNDALEKYKNKIYSRNLLDDLRLGLEKLLKSIFQNNKSIEKQVDTTTRFISVAGGSNHLGFMFVKLLEGYAKYQNAHVKHEDEVIEEELEFMIEMTATFMKHLVRLKQKQGA